MKNNKYFIDKDHPVSTRYYELITDEFEIAKTDEDVKEIISELDQLILTDPLFLDSYNFAADLYREELFNQEKALPYMKKAYELAIKIITDKEGNWPESLIWGHLENRHIIRAIDAWARYLWEYGEIDDALDLFRKLLKTNPNDNVGARHSILAIRMNLEPDYDLNWEVDGIGIDAGKLLKWWDKNYKSFPDEFAEWEAYLKSQN